MNSTSVQAIPDPAEAGLQLLSGRWKARLLWKLHLHDTWGRALANAQAGFEEGVRVFDASLGGLGGCPYAPGASGNVATEDLVDLFERSGVATGVALDALVDTTRWLQADVLRRPLPGRVFRARLGERERAAGGAG